MYTKEAMRTVVADLKKAAQHVEDFARMSGRESELLPLFVWIDQLAEELAEKAS